MGRELAGQVALVTGASKGIGRAIAAALSDAGAAVMLSSRKQEGLDDAVAAIRAANPDAQLETFAANAGEPEQAAACVAACIERLGALDVLVNNAATNPSMGATIDAELSAWDKTFQVNVRGAFVWSQLAWRSWMREHGGSIINISSIGGLRGDAAIGVYNTTNPSMGATIDAELSAWDKTFQVNVRGAFVWSQLAWRSWMREHGGSIINISSIGGLRGDAAIGVYNTTKAAIVHLTKILAVELGPSVRVNAIAPGLVKTDFARALWEPAGDAVAAGLPLRRLGEPEDVAHAARFLAGPGASWITGHTLVVDGGALAGAAPITQRDDAVPEGG